MGSWLEMYPTRTDPDALRKLYKRVRDSIPGGGASERILIRNGRVYAFVGRKHIETLRKPPGMYDGLAQTIKVLDFLPPEFPIATLTNGNGNGDLAAAPSIPFVVQPVLAQPPAPPPGLFAEEKEKLVRSRGVPRFYWLTGPGARLLNMRDKGLIGDSDIQHSVYVQYDVRPTTGNISVLLSRFRDLQGRPKRERRLPPFFWQREAGKEILARLHLAQITDIEAIREVDQLTGYRPHLGTIQTALSEYREREGLRVTKEVLAERVRQGMRREMFKRRRKRARDLKRTLVGSSKDGTSPGSYKEASNGPN